jgi:arylsulfatase A-like enzyme
MNAILVLVDSLNRHALSTYAPTHVATPNIDRFASRAQRFDGHFVGSLPCMPARREIFSGRKEMMWRPWGPLEPFDQRLPRLLEAEGHATALITDHYHYWEEAANGYMQSFQSAELIRGHEVDFWRSPVSPGDPVPGWVERIEAHRPRQARQYYGNVRDFRGEQDYFPAKVFTAASEWLKRHARERTFFLQVESFDVHEPFDVPEPYRSMYTGGERQRDNFNVWPPYQDPSALRRYLETATEEDLDYVRAQYAGKVSMVDTWFGKLLDTMDRLELWDETAVFLTTDHGHDLAERGAFGKQWPHFHSHAHIPLLVWHPEYQRETRHSALTSTVDLFATVLQVMGARVPEVPHSRSLLPLLSGGTSNHRAALLYGTFGQGVGCTDGEWTLLKSPVKSGEVYAYSSSILPSLVADSVRRPVGQGYFIPGVELPQWRIPVAAGTDFVRAPDLLFNQAEDPGQEHNLWDQDPPARRRMLGLLRDLLAEEGAPHEQFERLGLEQSQVSKY